MNEIFDAPAFDPAAREAYLRQCRDDMLAVLDSAAGQRFMARLLESLGLGQPLAGGEGEVAMRNMALQLLDMAREASPSLSLNLLAAVYRCNA